VDVGCGGGTYTRAWHELGAATVTGVDSSPPILDAAVESHGEVPGVRFVLGEASSTGLATGCADVVFERALVHHVADPDAVVAEARRLLRHGGVYLVQDRTPEDAFQPGSATHPRGWFFEAHPRLRHVEAARRPGKEALLAALQRAGLTGGSATTLWETRQVYADRGEYLAEVATRKGRSILHELNDDELARLVDYLKARLASGPVVEADRWTVWRAHAA